MGRTIPSFRQLLEIEKLDWSTFKKLLPLLLLLYLSKPLLKELSSLSHKDLDKIIKDAVSDLYESIDRDYFLLQIKKPGLINWKIES
jgi:hypothetical protein